MKVVRVALVAGAILLFDSWLSTQTHERPLVLLLVAVGVGSAVTVLLAVLGRRARALTAVLVVVSLGVACWVGANSSTVSWFGAQVSHGPRDVRQVAITFDDGPDVGATLAISRLLDERRAKGTFFSVGKAVERRPDIVQALVADGHLVGNHSYRHDSRGWLDPRYPELARTQQAIERVARVCPAFYRAPHGQHTPLLARVVHRRGMTMIGWDVSVGDWSASDPTALARRVLDKVRPGSIIDLHDGLDGNVLADRHVLVEAMPLILDGLAARHLTPVRLDQLIGRAGYLAHC